jgi:molybdopterin molybdotransferase
MTTKTPASKADRLIGVQEARQRVLGATPRLQSESLFITEALRRVLAQDLKAAHDAPRFACSAMDGYALKAGGAERVLRVAGESKAGAPASVQLHDGEAIRISTGAAIPEGADAVIRQEDVIEASGQIELKAEVASGANVRQAGEDILSGSVVLASGTILGAAELGVAVAAGAGEVQVSRRPRVTVISTGDELRDPGTELKPGEIYNTNQLMLGSLAGRCGALLTKPQHLGDNRAATEAALDGALWHADVVIVCGGVSVGLHDHVRPALIRLGVTQHFWGVALQPGKPTWFGTRGEKLVFGLPGNPVSAVVTFALFAAPALWGLQGGFETETHATARLAAPVPLNEAREQALRVRIENDHGRTFAVPTGPQGSHIVSSLVGADALALIPAGKGQLAAGTQVPLHALPN